MKSDEELIAELKEAADGLYFMSESDYPFEVVRLDKVSRELLREMSGAAIAAPVEVRAVDDFFRVAVSEPAWKGEQELATARRYQALLKILKENLDELKVYRIGKISIPVFILGKAPSGNWIGLSTRVVET